MTGQLDQATVEQISLVIDASRAALDKIAAMLGDRDLAFHVMPSSMFLAFASVSQLLKQSPEEQLLLVNHGMRAVTQVLAKRGISGASIYGKGRRCADITKEMAQAACETARKDIDGTNLVVDRGAARQKLLLKSALEYCAVAKLLDPKDLGAMMSLANERVAEVIRSGWLDRNTIKLGG